MKSPHRSGCGFVFSSKRQTVRAEPRGWLQHWPGASFPADGTAVAFALHRCLGPPLFAGTRKASWHRNSLPISGSGQAAIDESKRAKATHQQHHQAPACCPLVGLKLKVGTSATHRAGIVTLPCRLLSPVPALVHGREGCRQCQHRGGRALDRCGLAGS